MYNNILYNIVASINHKLNNIIYNATTTQTTTTIGGMPARGVQVPLPSAPDRHHPHQAGSRRPGEGLAEGQGSHDEGLRLAKGLLCGE